MGMDGDGKKDKNENAIAIYVWHNCWMEHKSNAIWESIY
jgi:hypothetical protein